jgi:uncharacterized protein (TIGR03067 family)
MRVLLGLLMVGIAGCGEGSSPPGDVAAPSSPAVTPVKAENAEADGPKPKADKPPAQAADDDPVAALKKLGAKIERNEQGEVLVYLVDTEITDAGLVHLKSLANLQSLALQSTKITDAGLVHLQGLTNLQTLGLSCPKITDAGMADISGIQSLQALRIGNTQITDAGLAHLQGLTKLRTLLLTGTKVTDAGMVRLKGLASLRILDLGDTQVTDSGMETLQKSIPACRIMVPKQSGDGHPSQVMQGRWFVVSGKYGNSPTKDYDKQEWQFRSNTLSQIRSPGSPSLKTKFSVRAVFGSTHPHDFTWRTTDGKTLYGLVRIYTNRLEICVAQPGNPRPKSFEEDGSLNIVLKKNASDASAVAAFKKLGAHIKQDDQGDVVEVEFSFNTRITNAGLVHLKGLTGLQELSLPSQITDAGLMHLRGLPNLQTLYLPSSQITDAGLMHLRGLPNLQTLSLYHNQKITDAGLVHLKGLTGLQELLLERTPITDAGLVHLKGLTGLEELYLRSTKITDAGLVHLKGLTGLQALRLPSQITDAGLVHLKGLTGLQTLYLRSTKITDAGLVHLKGLTGLQTLYLRSLKVTDTGVADLQKALPNCKIVK